ncbi:MAG: DNA methyltransferase [Anaerolineae bacterium]
METNVIYCGDNLEVLPKYVPDNSVDLIYIDPPFNTSRKYEVFWGEAVERRAFDDRYGDAMAYLDWMRPRIRHLYRVLKSTGSFYYHCDWHVSHYLKVELDRVFGANNFQNELVWKRADAHNDPKRYGRIHDSILFYTKSRQYTFNRIFTDLPETTRKKWYRNIEPETGRRYNKADLTASKPGGDTLYEWKGKFPPRGRYWAYSKQNMERLEAEGRIVYSKSGMPYMKRYEDESKGVPLQDVWIDIEMLRGIHKGARMGWPTEKPVPLMLRIIASSSNEGDVVLDAFCGCGSTLEAAAELKRRWIGMDFSPTACRVMATRLEERLGLRPDVDFTVRDLPKTEQELKRMPHFEFQNWAVLALGGIPNRVKVGDLGIDGWLYPAEHGERVRRRDMFVENYYPIQVKQKDRVGRPDIDSFETAMRRDRRVRGYFIGFSFSTDAIREIRRVAREEGLDIRPITVKQLLEYERVVG